MIVPSIEDGVDDEINILSMSNQPIEKNYGDLANLCSAKKIKFEANMKKYDEIKKYTRKIDKANCKKPKDQYSNLDRIYRNRHPKRCNYLHQFDTNTFQKAIKNSKNPNNVLKYP